MYTYIKVQSPLFRKSIYSNLLRPHWFKMFKILKNRVTPRIWQYHISSIFIYDQTRKLISRIKWFYAPNLQYVNLCSQQQIYLKRFELYFHFSLFRTLVFLGKSTNIGIYLHLQVLYVVFLCDGQRADGVCLETWGIS